MSILKNIFGGWINLFLDIVSDIKYKKEFKDRLTICQMCEHNKVGFCNLCGCWIKAKVRAENESCKIGKWKTIKETLNGKAH